MVRFFWRIAFFALATSVFAGERLNALVTAAQDFSVAIQQQLTALQGDISPAELVERTVLYAKAKTAYFNAFRAAMPELTDIATGRQPRPSGLDKFPAAFSVAGETHKKAADEATAVLLKQFSFDPDVERATAEFDRAQAVEEQFNRDFDWVDFDRNRPPLVRFVGNSTPTMNCGI